MDVLSNGKPCMFLKCHLLLPVLKQLLQHSGEISPSVCSTKGFSLGGNKLHSTHLVWYVRRVTFSETEGNPVCIFPL